MKRFYTLLLTALLLFANSAIAAVYSSPWGPRPQFIDANGAPMSSGTVTFYAAGSTTPQNTYTDSTGGVANPNPITLNTRGETPNEVWFTGGQTYKWVLKDSSGSTVWTVDNIAGINDITISNSPSEWIAGPAPTYVSATSFTLAGDQTLTFTAGRRVRTTNSGGTIYSIITSSVFGALTTITVANDSGSIDSGLSAVSYGMLASANSSQPPASDVYPQFENSSDKTKRMTVSLSALTTATNRTATAPDSNFNLGSPRGWIDGYTMSTAGSSATMTIAAGQTRDSTNASDITLAASIAKTTASFVVGSAQGCIDTGAIANTTWYHFYAILRPDTGVVDVLCSVSATAPTMPSNYSYKRRIGSGLTNGSAQWVKFIQNGDIFQWDVPVAELNASNPGTSAQTIVLTVPSGVILQAWFTALFSNQTSANAVLFFSDLATTDTAPDTTKAFSIEGAGASGTVAATGDFYVNTNVSGQIRYRLSASGASDIIRVSTKGWIDTRGRNK